jgi:thioredoxin-related protein
MIARRRLVLLPPALAGAAWSTGARAATLPTTGSLKDELAAALRQGKPLLVMASLDGCPFCRTVRDSYLAPLRAETGQPMMQLDMGSEAQVLDFEGASRTHDELLRSWKIRIAPTVLFFGKNGREVAQRLAGTSIPDFYGAYLEQRIRTAQSNLQ